MVLDKDSRVHVVTINTDLGLYRYTCLPFGIAFQCIIETILQGLKHLQCHIDDILITGVGLPRLIDQIN